MTRQKVDRNPVERVAVKLRYKAVIAAAEVAVQERGYKYISPVGSGDLGYMKPDGTPHDLTGATLIALGVTVPDSMNTSSVKKLRRANVIDCDNKTMEWLSVLQDAQDDGSDWGTSLLLANIYMLDRELPW